MKSKYTDPVFSMYSPLNRCAVSCYFIVVFPGHIHWVIPVYTTFTNFSMKFHLMCKVYTDVDDIK